MRFGLAQGRISHRHLAAVTRHAETVGFDSFWVPDHVALPPQLPAAYPYSDDGVPPLTPLTPLFDPWSVLGFVASATETMLLGTFVYLAPLRHPLLTARSAVTVDRLSSGRLILGAGVGWLESEFDLLGESFGDRGRRTDEIIGLLRRLWSEPTVSHSGPAYSVGPVCLEPKPINRTIPIAVGGTSSAALERAGRLGDGWLEYGSRDTNELSARIETIQRHRVEASRQHLPFEITVHRSQLDDPTAVHDLEAVGVSRILVSPNLPRSDTPAPVLSWIDRFSSEFIGS